jgi:hypothetical protein
MPNDYYVTVNCGVIQSESLTYDFRPVDRYPDVIFLNIFRLMPVFHIKIDYKCFHRVFIQLATYPKILDRKTLASQNNFMINMGGFYYLRICYVLFVFVGVSFRIEQQLTLLRTPRHFVLQHLGSNVLYHF